MTVAPWRGRHVPRIRVNVPLKALARLGRVAHDGGHLVAQHHVAHARHGVVREQQREPR
eukprot:CAMPEP_0180168158 /NCGR_PEP_ID=MMETSP0986-20121125/32528_1 /TAXON_ID=697907 /ORGANISM="non described non described, Strain CCMP2293" /LENGTH=58 /DNA_ID=CAMNT_0022119531 /DNA_START=162 /DNA_END=334 /DNA_ORIENTATION=-